MKVFLRQYFSVSKIIHHTPVLVYRRSVVDLAHNVYGKKDTGTGIPVVVLHGLLGSKKNWASMSDKISNECRRIVIAADIRNHGDSPHESTHTYQDLAADVSKLISSSGFKQADVIGHSMGGRTGMTLALTQPMQVHSLVVVDISPVSTAGVLNDFFPKLIQVMKAVDFTGKTSVAEARIFAKDSMMSSGLFDNPDSLYFILMNIGNRGGKIGWNYNLEALNSHFMDIATFPENLKSLQYKGPVLFIGGGRSPYLPKEDLTEIQNLFPKAELKYVPGVGHNVHAEDPRSFFDLVKAFLTANR